MNCIYFCEHFNPFSENKSGIEKKIFSQISALKEKMNVQVCYAPVPKDRKDFFLFVLPIFWSQREKNWKRAFFDGVDYTKIDCIYIRKPSLSINFYRILRKIKRINPRIKIMMEIPTYPNTNEYHGVAKVMVAKSVVCEKKLKQVIDLILTYSLDKEIWGIKCLNIANCVDYNSIAIREMYAPQKNVLRMTFVADFMFWHGADRIIKGVLNYSGSYSLVLNIVGGGKEIPNLKKIANNDGRIIFHGFKNNEEMNDIFNNTDIAIDSLGRHRSGVYYNSTLKGKEYSARGIPLVSAVETEYDHLPDFNYYCKVPADDTAIKIEDLIKFHEDILRNTDFNQISKIIREYSYRIFDFKNGFSKKIMEELGVIG